MSGAVRADVERFRPNLFHISLPIFLRSSVLRFAHRAGIRAIASTDTPFEIYPRPRHGARILDSWATTASRRFYSRCDAVVAPSDSAAETMERLHLAKHVGVWSRGVDPAIFRPGQRCKIWRKQMGFAESDVVVAFVGNLVTERGLADLALALDGLRLWGVPYRALIIGDGPAREWLSRRLRTAVFVGHLEDADFGRALASADILLNPSSNGGFDSGMLEAMACGLPVVTYQTTDNARLVLDGVTGVLAQPGRFSDLSRGLRRYIENPGMRMEHGHNALKHSENFSWDRTNATLVQTYLGVLGASN
jgi:glycosyltransferase involved in cell wall biosynthesis